MKFFNNLDNNEFNVSLSKFLDSNPNFQIVKNIKEFNDKQGYYLMILDEYKQIYLGTSDNIYKRIYQHWHKQKPFDRLIFGGVENSILSIDSFRPLDTTRLYAWVTNNIYHLEDRLINQIPNKFMLNRTMGGILKGELLEAIKN